MEKLVCIQDFKEEAFRILDQNALDYYKSGADEEITLEENRRAFHRWVIRPRVLRDVSSISLGATVLGKRVEFPFGVSPTAMQKMAHPDGEVATAKAAAAMGSIYTLSTVASCSIEEIAEAIPEGRKWFQLYVYKDRDLSTSLIRRAEKAGFEALVLTVDLPYAGKRRVNLRNKFSLPRHLRLANFESGTTESENVKSPTGGSALNDYIQKLFDPSLTWETVTEIKQITRLPLIIKGILTVEDARLAVQYGADAVFVSNHGGRQLDTVLPTIDALPEIAAEMKGKIEVYVDGGVSSGNDVFKALALGAKMVFAGRPFIWGLAVGGEEGVQQVLQIVKDELKLTMALAGVDRVCGISPEYVARPARF